MGKLLGGWGGLTSWVSPGCLSLWPRHLAARVILGRCLLADLPVPECGALCLQSWGKVPLLRAARHEWQPWSLSPVLGGTATCQLDTATASASSAHGSCWVLISCLTSSPICYCWSKLHGHVSALLLSCGCLLWDRVITAPILLLPTSPKVSLCTGFAWQDFASGGAAGLSAVRSCQKLSLCLSEPMPAGSKVDLRLAKAEPTSDGGSTSGIT